MNGTDKEAIKEFKKQIVKIPYHDILSLTSILTQETKKGENEHE
jgi:hypothetical protein